MRRALALCLAVAACAPAPNVDGLGQEIIGGSFDTGMDLAVGFLISRQAGGGAGLCSASMITRRVVMTAAHCLIPATSREIWFLDAYNVRTGETQGLVDSQRRVAVKEWIHPGYQPPAFGNDIGLLLLDKPIPASITSMPWNRTRIGQDYVGMDVRPVGFGHRVFSSDDPDFIKLTTRSPLASLGTILETQGETRNTCQGDSGGPALMKVNGREVIAGITSYGDTGCAMYSAFSRVDLFLHEIDAFIAENDPQTAQGCGADGTCGYPCTAVDPDCPCVSDGQCGTACTKPNEDPDCPEGCGRDDQCVRAGCPTKDPDCGDKALGDACASGNECTGGVCAAFEGGKVCSQSCNAMTSCPAATSCNNNVCLPESSGGCSCAVGAGPGSAAWILVVLGLALERRRRHHVRHRRDLA